MVAPESKSNGHASASQGSPGPDPNLPHPLEPLMKHLAELREYVSYYLETTADGVKLSVRRALINAVLGLLGLVAGIAAIITATVLVLAGAANGLAELLGGRLWAGQLITGIGLLLFVCLAAWLGVRSLTNSSRRKTIEKYERRQHEQQARFGHDVTRRAAGGDGDVGERVSPTAE